MCEAVQRLSGHIPLQRFAARNFPQPDALLLAGRQPLPIRAEREALEVDDFVFEREQALVGRA